MYRSFLMALTLSTAPYAYATDNQTSPERQLITNSTSINNMQLRAPVAVTAPILPPQASTQMLTAPKMQATQQAKVLTPQEFEALIQQQRLKSGQAEPSMQPPIAHHAPIQPGLVAPQQSPQLHQSPQIAPVPEQNHAPHTSDAVTAQDETIYLGPLAFNRQIARNMLTWQDRLNDKAAWLVKARQDGTLKSDHLYFSAELDIMTHAEKSNTENKFPILSRFPSAHIGTEDFHFIYDKSVAAVTGTYGDYLTGHVQMHYMSNAFPTQDRVQFREYFVTVGNLNEYPFYASFGRQTVPFGSLKSYAPFTAGHANHYFWAVSDDPVGIIGYMDHGMHLTAAAIPAGRHLRSMDTDKDGFFLNNFALNGEYSKQITDDIEIKLGAGYLHGTIYNSAIAHHTIEQADALDDRDTNGAYALNAELSYNGFDVLFEYISTLKKWPATDARVETITAQGRYGFQIEELPISVSAQYSKGIQGPSGTDTEFMDQFVLGVETELSDYFRLGAEYVHNRGFVPLGRLSASDRNVKSDTFAAGLKFSF